MSTFDFYSQYSPHTALLPPSFLLHLLALIATLPHPSLIIIININNIIVFITILAMCFI